jgi:hypothetical protein
MSENINSNYDPVEETGELYNTQIPELSEDANIQEALKYFHYGTLTTPTQNSEILENSLAGHLKNLKTQVQVQASRGIGSDFGPTLPLTPEDGFVFVKSNSTAAVFSNTQLSAIYDPVEPTENLIAGMLWADSSLSPAELSIYTGVEFVPVSSQGGSATAPGSYIEKSLTGLGTDVIGLDATTATGFGVSTIFGYIEGADGVPFAATLPVTNGMTKIEVQFSFGFQSTSTTAGDIQIARVLNGNFAAPTPVGKVYFSGGATPPHVVLVDTHGQVEGSVISYVMFNSTTETITFDGNYIIQAIAKEVA